MFRREGPAWRLTYRGVTVLLKDAKGLRDIAMLLARPEEAVNVAELGGPVEAADETAKERLRVAVKMRIANAIAAIHLEHPRLGRHLERSIRTGGCCRYSPEEAERWVVRTS